MKLKLLIFLLLGFIPSIALAHQPILEPETNPDLADRGLYLGSTNIGDPTKTSFAVYGAVSEPKQYDLYAFVPAESVEIPVQMLIPFRNRNKDFNPQIAVIAKSAIQTEGEALPFELPPGYQTQVLSPNNNAKKFFEPFSLERYRTIINTSLKVEANQNYFLIVYDPSGQMGDYALGLGTKEDFSDTSKLGLIKNVLQIKSGLVNNIVIPWLDFIGLFILLSGLVIGLGAVTVIDVHGFMARHSGYWTKATITAHKITKPLIWLGIGLVIIGSALFYRNNWLNGVVVFQALLVLALLLNGLFLTFKISPMLIKKEQHGNAEEPLSLQLRNIIAISFLISFIGWWGNLALISWYLLMQS